VAHCGAGVTQIGPEVAQSGAEVTQVLLEINPDSESGRAGYEVCVA
jgi:hypothetical protein